MLEIGQPLLLLAAAGILIPLAIHLWNRRPPRIIATGSTRWFRGSSSQSARSLKLKDRPLLLLRCLLLLVFSLLLAGLFWQKNLAEENNKSLYLVEPALATGKSQEWTDSLHRMDREVRLLAPGLPPLSDSLKLKNQQTDVWGVLKEADGHQLYADTVWVYSSLFQRNFRGERPILHKQFFFEEPPYLQQAAIFPASITKTEDALQGREISYLPERISFQERELSAEEAAEEINKTIGVIPSIFGEEKLSVAPVDTFFIGSAVSNTFKQDAEMVRQAFRVLDSYLPEITVHFTEGRIAEGADLFLWFKEEPLPKSLLRSSATVLGISKEGRLGNEWLIQPEASTPKSYYLGERPLPAFVEKEKLAALPLALMDLLPAGLEVHYAGYLRMPLSQAKPYLLAGEERKNSAEKQDLHEWLWVLLFLLFVVERIWVNLK